MRSLPDSSNTCRSNITLANHAPTTAPITCTTTYAAASPLADAGARPSSQHPVGGGDDGVEVGTGNRAEHQNQDRQAENGGGRILEELEADVVWRQLGGGDSRAHHHRDQQGGAHELRQKSSRQSHRVIYRLPIRLSVPSSE